MIDIDTHIANITMKVHDMQTAMQRDLGASGPLQLCLFGDASILPLPGTGRSPHLRHGPCRPPDEEIPKASGGGGFGSGARISRELSELETVSTGVALIPVQERTAEAAVEPTAARLSPHNFRELIDRMRLEVGKDRREIEARCAVQRVGDLLRRPLQDIPTEPARLRPLLMKVTPASAGMSAQRWSRIKSLVAHALRTHGIDLQPARDVAGHSASWKALASIAPTRGCRLGLSRFMSFCSRRGIEPLDVSATTFDGFRAALEAGSLKDTPETMYRKAVRCWNRAVEAEPRWPQTAIPIDRHKRFYSFDWGDFPPSFKEDVEAYLGRSGSDDIFAADYRDPSRPATITLRRRELRQLASLLVLSGFAIEQITGLAVLVRPENATAALKQQVVRTDKAIGSSLEQQAWLLKIIAREWVGDTAAEDALAKLASRLRRKTKGMTDRNTERLRQFDLQANVDALLRLPEKVFHEARREKVVTPALARRVMLALAVDMLTVAPLRANNIVGLELDRHLLTLGRGRAEEWHILIPAEETKQGELMEMRLPAGTVQRLQVFLKRYRPDVWEGAAPWLFVSPEGKRRSTISFCRAISDFIFRETGLIMNVHLFRALAAKLHLKVHPEDVETVRRLLGHKRSDTTHRHYIENRSQRSFDKYSEMIEGRRANAQASRSVRRAGK